MLVSGRDFVVELPTLTLSLICCLVRTDGKGSSVKDVFYCTPEPVESYSHDGSMGLVIFTYMDG